MEQLLLIALIGTCAAVLLRSLRAEYAVPVGVATAVLLLLTGLKNVTVVAETLQKLTDAYSVPSAVLRAVLKIVGLSFLTDFGANVCRDAGQNAIAANLEFGGKVLILLCALPAAAALLETGASLMKEVIS